MSLLVDIGSLLTGVNNNIFYNDRPDTPDNCIVIYYTGGQPSVHNMNTQAPTLEKPTFQVAIRNTSCATAETQAEEIKDILNGKTSTTINDTLYEAIWLQGDIFNLGKDDRERSILTINFVAWVRR
jgi:hypothetical protein